MMGSMVERKGGQVQEWEEQKIYLKVIRKDDHNTTMKVIRMDGQNKTMIVVRMNEKIKAIEMS